MHRRTSALLRDIGNIRVCLGKKPIVSVAYENVRISLKKHFTLHKMCVTSLLCGPWADLWPFYGLYSLTVTETIGFFPIQILIFPVLRNNADVRRCSLFRAWATCGLAIPDTSYLHVHFFGTHTCLCRLQNCPYFGVFKFSKLPS